MAKDATVKKFRRMDGSLLSDPPTAIDVDDTPRNRIPLTDAARDIDQLDSLPFDHDVDDDDSLAGYLASAAFGRDESDDDSDGGAACFGTL
jgi:hypothetical protein